MPNFVMSSNGNQFLNMILEWEKTHKLMREEDDRFVRAKMLVDGRDYTFFFLHKGSVYGGNENARPVFATMKKPAGEVGVEDMNFQAVNLSKEINGEPKQGIFLYKDIGDIKIIKDKEEVYELLMNTKKGKNDKTPHPKATQSHPVKKNRDGRIMLNKDFEEL